MLDTLLTFTLHLIQIAVILTVWLLSTAGIVACYRQYRLRRLRALKPRSPPWRR